MFEPEKICLSCFKRMQNQANVCPHCGCDNSTLSNESHQLECGSILAGTYLIGKAIGQGGFGITYVGWDLNLSMKVAIKEYYPEGCVTRDTHTHVSVLTYAGAKEAFFQKGKERFVEEARVLARFSGDSGVVGVRTFFFENSTAYIVMDFVEGETLKSYAARKGGKLHADEVLTLFKPLMKSLVRVHDNNLLHRDISPDNIMIRPDGTLALLDFGAARQISAMGERSNTINVKHGYAPEEQYRTHGEQGPWTDIYALCATIYRLTTGVTPTEALDRAINETELTPPNQLGADFTPAQQSVIMRGLAVRANQRTQNMRELMEELYGDAHAHTKTGQDTEKINNTKQSQKTSGAEFRRPAGEKGQPAQEQTNQTKQQVWARKKWPYAAVGLLCVVIAAIAIFTKNPAHPSEGAATADIVAATATENSDVTSTAVPVGLSGERIRIGTISPNTGALAEYGKDVTQAVDLAVDEINATGGILGRKVVVLKTDDQFDPAITLDSFNSLVSQDVGLIIGSVTAGCTSAITGAANENKVVLITPCATADSITTTDDYVFRACYSDSSQGAIAAYGAKAAGYSDVGIVYCSTDSYSSSLRDAFISAADRYGLNVKTIETTESLSVTEYTKQFKAMIESGVQFVYAPFYYDVVGPYLIPQARAAGYSGVIMGADGYDGVTLYLPDRVDLSAFNDVYWTNHFDPSDNDPMVQKFVKAYGARWSEEPDSIAALAYDAVYILKQAIEKAGTDEPSAVRAALADTSAVYSRVTGNFSMDETGTPIKGAAIIAFSSDGVSITTKLLTVIRNLLN